MPARIAHSVVGKHSESIRFSDESLNKGLQNGRIRFTHDWESDIELAVSITNAVAVIEDTSRESIANEVAGLLDGDALDRLFTPSIGTSSPRNAGYIVVAVSESVITITKSGDVIVECDPMSY